MILPINEHCRGSPVKTFFRDNYNRREMQEAFGKSLRNHQYHSEHGLLRKSKLDVRKTPSDRFTSSDGLRKFESE